MSAKKKKASIVAPTSRKLKLPQLMAVALLLLAVLMMLYPDAALKGNIFASADAGNSDAFASVADASLAEGHYPLWNPYLFAGMPTFGSLAYVKFVYPPTAVFNFLQQKLGFPPMTWMLGHLLFGGLGMAWLLKRWRLPTGALVLGAIVWIVMPKIVAWGVHGHGTKLGAAMYLPWIVGASLNVLSGRGLRAVALTALLLGLQFLRGHIQITYYTLLLVGWLTLWNGIRQITPGDAIAPVVRWKRAGLLLVALLLAMAIGSALLMPVYSYQAQSVRGGTDAAGGAGMDYATGWSLAPSEVPTLWLPTAAGFGKATYLGQMPFNDYPNYFGLLLMGLAAAAWGKGRRWLLAALATASLLALAVSFGRHWSAFYGLLYDYLPFFNKFRIPSMILVLPGFALALLAAQGITRLSLSERSDGVLRFGPWVLGGIGALLLMGGATELGKGPWEGALRSLAESAGKNPVAPLMDAAWRLHRADLVRIGLVLLTAGAALLLAYRKESFRRQGLVWTMAALLLIDLAAVDNRIVYPEKSLQQVAQDSSGRGRLVTAARLSRPYRPDSESAAPVAAFSELAAMVGHERVWPLGGAGGSNDLMSSRVRSLGGYHPAKLASFQKIRARLNAPGAPAGRLAAWLGASHLLVDGRLPEEYFEPLRALGLDLDPQAIPCASMMVYGNRAALPRVRLVDTYVPVAELPAGADQDAFLDAVQNEEHDFRTQVLLEETPSPAPAAGGAPLPPVRHVLDDMDEVVLQADCPRPAVLVLADMYAPGWKVEVDGRPAELLRADLFLRAVALDAGSHEVRFSYHDPAVRIGMTACVAGLLVVLAMFLGPWIATKMRGGKTHQSDASKEAQA